jgi:isovaleryl-CoA dehydrogenase
VNQIALNGSEGQKRKYLPSLLTGEHVGALAMSEAGAGSDVVSMTLRAEDRGDHLLLNGTKMWITNGPQADTLVGYAKTDPSAGAKGITALIIEKAFEGFSASPKLDKLGIRGSDTSELVFNNCRVPKENVLGSVNGGVRILMSGLDYERITAAVPLGIMEASLGLVIPYIHSAAVRPADRKVPTRAGEVADMYTSLELRAHTCMLVRRGGPGRSDATGCGRGVPLCFGTRDRSGAGCDAAAWRERIHERLSGGPAGSRRQAS